MNIENISNYLFIFAGILWAVEMLPQIIKTTQRKSVEDISLLFYITCWVAYVAFLSGAFLIQNWYLFIAHTPACILIMVMIFLIVKYRRRP